MITRRLLVASFTVVLLVAGCATGGEGPADPSRAPDGLTPDGLVAAVTIDNVVEHLEALQAIADRHGGNRAAGTSGYRGSVDYVADRLSAAGFRVSTPTFTYERFEPGPVELVADQDEVDARVLTYSAGTAGRPVSGRPVAVAGLGCADSDYPPTLRGAVAVIVRGSCTFADKTRRAQAAGALAVVVVNNAPGPLIGATLDAADRPTIATVGIEAAAADTVRTAEQVTLSVVADTRTIRSQNVIAETTTGAADDVVVAGAHLDSVTEGPGMNDNASGVAALLETALRLGGAPPTPRAVRFAFWGAEEDGLIGSARYVESLDDTARRAIAAYLNFDMLGSPNGGYFVHDGDDSAGQGAGAGPPGSADIERVFTGFYADRDIEVRPTDFDGRSDYGPFIEVGIPAGGVLAGAEGEKTTEQAALWGGEAGAPFDPNYHGPADDIDNVNTEILAVNAGAVAYAVASFALSPS